MKKPRTSNKPVLFLFDSDSPEAGTAYGHKFDSAFLCVLETIDQEKATRSQVFRGDLLIRSLCYKPSRVASQDWTKSSHSQTKFRSSIMQQSADMALFKLLTGEFCNSLENQWHTLDLTKLLEKLMQLHTLYCIFLPTFPSQKRTQADKGLSQYPWYAGATESDLSNPLQRELLVNSLFRDALIEHGEIYMPLGFEGELDGDFHGSDKFSSWGIITLPLEEFSKRVPPMPMPDELTARAIVTMARLRNRRALSVHERLANQLIQNEAGRTTPVEFDWDLKQLPSSPDEVEVQARKLTEYLLNDAHKEGASKSRFFRKELGITSEDWRFLQGQFIDALSDAEYKDVRVDAHGIRFSALLPIQGRNEQTATIKTAWIIRPRERATLVTAVPGTKETISQPDVDASPVVPPGLESTDRWQAIYDRAIQAARKAANDCVPTPMKVTGGELIMDGECGGSYVLVPDARKGFARWLKDSGHGNRHHRGGVTVYAITNSQSVERAVAFSNAFARVLRRNGIDCSVSRYLT